MDAPLLVILNPTALRGDAGVGFARARAALPADTAVRETVGDGADVARIGEWAATPPRAPSWRRVATAPCAPSPVRWWRCPRRSGQRWAWRRSGPPTTWRAGAAWRASAATPPASRPPWRPGSAPRRGRSTSAAPTAPGSSARARPAWTPPSSPRAIAGARWRLGPRLGGYPLYLLACAVGLARHRAVAAELVCDGDAAAAVVLHDLLVLNTALYAGEFRFDDADHSADGRLDVHAFPDARAYVRGFVTAWRRHLGAAVPPPSLRRVATASVRFAAPTPLQLDGEEAGLVEQLRIEVEPAAVQVLASNGRHPSSPL
ncbi:MAG: hypothetical protein U0802_04970 [Candidatus Binatia bacterium]